MYSQSQQPHTPYTLCKLHQSYRHPPHKLTSQRSGWSNMQSCDDMDINQSENCHSHNTSASYQLYIHPC